MNLLVSVYGSLPSSCALQIGVVVEGTTQSTSVTPACTRPRPCFSDSTWSTGLGLTSTPSFLSKALGQCMALGHNGTALGLCHPSRSVRVARHFGSAPSRNTAPVPGEPALETRRAYLEVTLGACVASEQAAAATGRGRLRRRRQRQGRRRRKTTTTTATTTTTTNDDGPRQRQSPSTLTTQPFPFVHSAYSILPSSIASDR